MNIGFGCQNWLFNNLGQIAQSLSISSANWEHIYLLYRAVVILKSDKYKKCFLHAKNIETAHMVTVGTQMNTLFLNQICEVFLNIA